ncbi:MAG: cadmium-translocating P-type ATPase [Aquificota bacterium]|nr:MAG: cadmium-translocating P-type ATPase [Aquificota bacterium]
MKVVLKVSGMTCVNCAKAIELSLRKLKGVEEVKVSFELGRVVVGYKEELLSLEQIKEAIESLGYRVEGVRGKDRSLEVLAFCWLASLGIMLFMFFHWGLYLQALLSLGVQVVGGYSFYRSAWHALRSRVGNMDLLVVLGSTSALIYSFLALAGFLSGEPFFETSAFLITFVRTGKYIEEWVRSRALRSLKELFNLQTIRVKVLKGEREELKRVDELFVGDLMILRSGDMVPVDCRIVEGQLELDESFITGESMPVKRSSGELVLSGSLVVSGFAKARVEKTFKNSYANLLVSLVESALSQKPKVQRIGDRVSHYFVQFVVLLSLFVFTAWYVFTGDVRHAINFSLAVLVVSCPCAFGIAVPLAVVMGLLRAYKKGLLIKNPSVFEQRLDVLIFDKTGTLTEGKPELVDYRLYEPKALELACAMAETSNHPYSLAIRRFCQQRGIKGFKLQECKETPGEGVRCGELFLGRANGQAHAYLMRGDKRLAEFFFEDKLREGVEELVKYLKRKGVRLYMLTGDSPERAKEVAQRLSIDQYIARAKPEDKLRVVQELQSQGLRVGVVGDGINDAPALSKADLSFAVGSGTDIAKRVGDVVLLRGVESLVDFFELKDRTLRRIKQNLFWAFLYNVLFIPIAGGLLYHQGIYLKPEYAGLLMALSSLSVVMNSLR